jgi:hypothetical protein
MCFGQNDLEAGKGQIRELFRTSSVKARARVQDRAAPARLLQRERDRSGRGK